MSRGPLELDEDRMRRLAREVADRLVDRWVGLRDAPAMGSAGRAEMEERLRRPLPYEGEPLETVLADFWEHVEPFAARADHPRFFAFVPSSPTFASVLGDWLASGCNFFQGTWLESAGPSQLELVVLDWLKEALGLPAPAEGVLTSGGSAANLVGLAVAREDRLGPLPAGGVAYGSEHTHSSVERAFRLLGLGPGGFRKLPADAGHRLDPETVRRAVAGDRAAGRRPFCVVANAGTTNTGAVDPLPPLAELCAEEGLWLHVDGAFGAFGRLTVRGRPLLEGLELADSLVLDPHKWLYVGFECGCLLVRRPGLLERTFRVLPDYLQDVTVRGEEVNFADRGLQLSRRARAVALWASLRTHGFAGMIAAIDRTQHLADLAARRIRETPGLELLSPPSLGVLCFRYVGAPPVPATGGDSVADGINEAVVRQIQEEGRFMLSSTRLGGCFVLRLCPLNYRTTAGDLFDAIADVRRLGDLNSGCSP